MSQGPARKSLWTPPPLVSALPASPYDGQEVYYAAEPARGITWHLRYRADSASSYKWEFVGGPPIKATDLASVACPAATTWANVAPSLTLPLAGEYEISCNAGASGTSAGVYLGFGYTINAVRDGNDATSCAPVAAGLGIEMPTKTRRKVVAAAGYVIQGTHAVLVSGAGTTYNRDLSALPVRLI